MGPLFARMAIRAFVANRALVDRAHQSPTHKTNPSCSSTISAPSAISPGAWRRTPSLHKTPHLNHGRPPYQISKNNRQLPFEAARTRSEFYFLS